MSADSLLFEKGERAPDEGLRFQVDAISNFLPEEKLTAEVLLEGLIFKHQAKRWSAASGVKATP